MKKLILGPPGTGKTTKLLSIVDEYLQAGVPPERIAFVTFTKSGAEEAVTRACDKFDMRKKRFPNFKTLHAIAFRETGCKGVMQWREYKELSQDLGYNVTGDDDLNNGYSTGQLIKHVEEQARTRCIDIETCSQELMPDLNAYQVVHYQKTLERYKEVNGAVDFTDLIQKFVGGGYTLDIDVLIVDEAQDLTELQWRMVDGISETATDIFYAGDDDQTVHVWAGACIDRFMALGDHCGETEVLSHSYRLCETVHQYANSLSGRIQNRYYKDWGPNDHFGTVQRLSYPAMGSLPLHRGEWMLLARNRRSLDGYKWLLKGDQVMFSIKGEHYLGALFNLIKLWGLLLEGETLTYKDVTALYSKCLQKNVEHGNRTFRGIKGLRYSLKQLVDDYGLCSTAGWFDAFDRVLLSDRIYMRGCLENNEEKPRINLMTIHASKGREADNVVLLSDCSKASADELYNEPDSEHRVFYVGATRAKKNLYLVGESSEYFYPL